MRRLRQVCAVRFVSHPAHLAKDMSPGRVPNRMHSSIPPVLPNQRKYLIRHIDQLAAPAARG